jgi:hypothetical protein
MNYLKTCAKWLRRWMPVTRGRFDRETNFLSDHIDAVRDRAGMICPALEKRVKSVEKEIQKLDNDCRTAFNAHTDAYESLRKRLYSKEVRAKEDEDKASQAIDGVADMTEWRDEVYLADITKVRQDIISIRKAVGSLGETLSDAWKAMAELTAKLEQSKTMTNIIWDERMERRRQKVAKKEPKKTAKKVRKS